MFTTVTMERIAKKDFYVASRILNVMNRTEDYLVYDECTMYPSDLKSIVTTTETAIDGGHAIAYFPAWSKAEDVAALAMSMTIHHHLRK